MGVAGPLFIIFVCNWRSSHFVGYIRVIYTTPPNYCVCENLILQIVCGNKHTHTASHNVSKTLLKKSVVQVGVLCVNLCGGKGGFKL